MRRWILVGWMGLITLCCHAQSTELIKGLVGDSATFEALPYVTVRIKNKNHGTLTDNQGSFTLLASRRDTIVFSIVGYKTLEVPLYDWEPSLILLAENVTVLDVITIRDSLDANPYEGMFDEQNELLKKNQKRLPFYYSKGKKQKIKVQRLAQENVRVKTYVDVVINRVETKEKLIQQYHLTEEQYYHLLERFNEKNYTVMYYVTAGELLTMLNNFFARNAH